MKTFLTSSLFMFCAFFSFAPTARGDAFEDMFHFMSSFFSFDSLLPNYQPTLPQVSTKVSGSWCVMTLDLEGLDPSDDDVHVHVLPSTDASAPAYVTVAYTQVKHLKDADAQKFKTQFDGFLAPFPDSLSEQQSHDNQQNITMTVTSEAARSFPLPLECDASSPQNSKFAVEHEDKLVVKFPVRNSVTDTDTQTHTHTDTSENADAEKKDKITDSNVPADAQFEIKRARLEEF